MHWSPHLHLHHSKPGILKGLPSSTFFPFHSSVYRKLQPIPTKNTSQQRRRNVAKKIYCWHLKILSVTKSTGFDKCTEPSDEQVQISDFSFTSLQHFDPTGFLFFLMKTCLVVVCKVHLCTKDPQNTVHTHAGISPHWGKLHVGHKIVIVTSFTSVIFRKRKKDKQNHGYTENRSMAWIAWI